MGFVFFEKVKERMLVMLIKTAVANINHATIYKVLSINNWKTVKQSQLYGHGRHE